MIERGIRAVHAVLGEDHAGDLRVVARREEHEPAMVAQVLRRPRRGASRVGDDLCRAGLAADVLAVDARARPVPLGELTTFHMPSRIACSFSGLTSTTDCGGGAGTGFHCRPVGDRLEDVRRDAGAAVAPASPRRPPARSASPTPVPGRSPRKWFRRRTTSARVVVAFQAVDGTSPVTSLGKSMFDFTPSPKSVAHLWMRSTPSMLPTL